MMQLDQLTRVPTRNTPKTVLGHPEVCAYGIAYSTFRNITSLRHTMKSVRSCAGFGGIGSNLDR